MPDQFNALMQKFGAGRSMMIVVVAIAAIAMLWVVSSWANKPALVPLVATSDMASVAAITSKLEEAGIHFELTKGGSQVDVAERDVARARVMLASEGIPAKGQPGFELFDKPAWGMTDFTQRINYRRALEGELERTIGAMSGVQAAQVHLALSQESSYRTQPTPEAASVVLTLTGTQRPSDELVEGIGALIAGSVDGLTSDHVTVMDNAGRLLSKANEGGSADGLNRKQLGMRREVEEYLESRAEELVTQIVGAGNTRVRVAAEINFDQLDRTTQRINPDEQLTLKEEKSQITPAEGQVAAGSTQTSATYDATRTTETFSSAAGNIKRLTVAVLVNQKVVSAADVQHQVEMLVRNAVGIDTARGDAISVVATPFDVVSPATEPKPPAVPIMDRVAPIQKPVLTVLAIALTFLLARTALQMLRTPAPIARAMEHQALLGSVDSPVQMIAERSEAVPRIEQQRVSAAIQQPEMTARVLRTWMKES
jgi:flagellar M-ring protein FliF